MTIASSSPQNSLRFGHATAAATPVRKGLSHWFFRTATNLGEKEASSRLKHYLNAAGAKVMAYDTHELHKVSLPKISKKLPVTEPPFGMLLLLLYPFTIGARLYRAIKRDETGTEKWDVLRRDLTAITLFVFMLKPLTTALKSVLQKMVGLKLVDKKKHQLLGKAFGDSQLEAFYRLSNASKLEQIVAEGNGKGLVRAVNNAIKNYKIALHHLDGHEDILKGLEQFKKLAVQMTEVVERGQQNPGELNALAKQAFGILQNTQTLYDNKFKAAGEQAAHRSASLAQKIFSKITKNERILPETFEAIMGEYAKKVKLPISILSFLTVVLAIGWFPVKFNEVLSRKRRMAGPAPTEDQPTKPGHQQQQAPPANAFQQPFATPTQSATPGNLMNPRSTFEALKRSSRLHNKVFSA